MICKSCGTAASDEVRLCPGCGAPQITDSGTVKPNNKIGKEKPGRWVVFLICLLSYAVISAAAFIIVGIIA